MESTKDALGMLKESVPDTTYTSSVKHFRIELKCTQAQMDVIMGRAVQSGAHDIEYVCIETYVAARKEQRKFERIRKTLHKAQAIVTQGELENAYRNGA